MLDFKIPTRREIRTALKKATPAQLIKLKLQISNVFAEARRARFNVIPGRRK